MYRCFILPIRRVAILRRICRIPVLTAAALVLTASVVAAQGALTIPPPRGMLSDFAGVVSADRADQIERLAQFVRAKSGGEIAIVTLHDLGGRDVGDVALQIGRDWKRFWPVLLACTMPPKTIRFSETADTGRGIAAATSFAAMCVTPSSRSMR